MSFAKELFTNLEELYGVIIEYNNNPVIKLFGDDIVFWIQAYNSLNADVDYNFYIIGKKNKELINIEISESVFLDLMELLDFSEIEENLFISEKAENKNHRLHKLVNLLEIPD